MIHCYRLGGYNIIIDVHSGAIHVVDDLFYELVQLLKAPLSDVCPEEVLTKLSSNYAKDDINDSYNEILELYHKDQLFSVDDYEQFADKLTPSPLKSMCLHIAHDCNLRCQYCFASTGDFGGARMRMPLEVGIKAIDYLLERSANRRNLEVDFFGGEPLMNFEVVKEVVKYARSKEKEYNKNFRFTITTNGLLLDDDKIDFINKEMSNVVLSIDGRKSVNDKIRSRIDGRGCYDDIMPKFLKLCEKRGFKDYYVRGTFTKYNLDFGNDVTHLNSLGFDQISVEPVVSDSKMPYSLTEADLPAISEEYKRLANLMIKAEKDKKGFNFFHFMIDLDQGPCAIKRLRGCSAGNEYCAVTPDGEVYPCHQFVGHEEWKLGDIFSNTFDENRKKQFASATIYQKEDCKNCWAKFYCSGGCNANNMMYEGSILKPLKISCELEKMRLECAIMIKVALADEEM